MLKEKVVVNSEIGLNARVASMFLRNSVKFNSDIILIKIITDIMVRVY